MPLLKNQIRDFVVDNVESNSNKIVRLTAEKFKTSRQYVNNQINALIHEGILYRKGDKKGARYFLKSLVKKTFHFVSGRDRDESKLWDEHLSGFFLTIQKNVSDICHFG
ncbi:MAG: hypothetical protein V3U15_04995, partial [Nitrospinota bacterium]